MKRFLAGTLMGAIIYFVWGWVSWGLLPWHDLAMHPMPQEQLVSDTLKTVIPGPGIYVFPYGDPVKAAQGPVGFMAFSKGGDFRMRRHVTFGFLGALVIAALTMSILIFARGSINRYYKRSLIPLLLGALAWTAIQLPYWNWFHFPADFTLISLADTLIGFLLLGLAQAAFVKQG